MLCENKYSEGILPERKHMLIKALVKDDKKKIVPLNLTNNKNSSHTVIYTGYKDNYYKFVYMRKNDNEKDLIVLTKSELLKCLSSSTQYAYIKKAFNINSLDKNELLKVSFKVLQKYKQDLIDFCTSDKAYIERINNRDRLFRALLLNYVDVSEIIEYKELSNLLCKLQRQYINTFKQKETLQLCDYIDMQLLKKVFQMISDLIIEQSQ